MTELEKTFARIKSINDPEGDDMPMYVTVAQDCGGEYGIEDGWRAWVRLEYDGIEVAQCMGGSFEEAVNKAIDIALGKDSTEEVTETKIPIKLSGQNGESDGVPFGEQTTEQLTKEG